VTIDILESGLSVDLERRAMDDDSDVYMIFYGLGMIVWTTSGAEHKVFGKLPEYDAIHAAVQHKYYDQIPKWEKWRDNQHTMPKPEKLSSNYFTRSNNGGFLVAVSVPPFPEYPWENPDYVPVAFVVQKIQPTILKEFDDFADRVRQDVKKNIILCVLLGVFGLLLVLSILASMSNVLTQPLTWITKVARKVINNASHKNKRRHRNNGDNGDIMVKIRKASQKKQTMSSSSVRYNFSEDNNCPIRIEDPDNNSFDKNYGINHRDL